MLNGGKFTSFACFLYRLALAKCANMAERFENMLDAKSEEKKIIEPNDKMNKLFKRRTFGNPAVCMPFLNLRRQVKLRVNHTDG